MSEALWKGAFQLGGVVLAAFIGGWKSVAIFALTYIVMDLWRIARGK